MKPHKQPSLKPQDVVVVVKIALARGEMPTYAQLAQELHMSVSEVHGAAQRAAMSRLLETSPVLRVNRTALREFLLQGVKYAFPLVEGPVARGLPTGVSAPSLSPHFEHGQALPLVWPDADGEVRGSSICPLYPTVPAACREDEALYHVLALLDAIRGGAAREREMAIALLNKLLP